MLDFTILAKRNEFRILQLTDMQIIDAEQQRFPTRLKDDERIAWKIENVEEMLFSDMDRLVSETNPDLIVITGDIIYGEFDDNGTSLHLFIDRMESYGIPWAPVWGNHDNECAKGADWQCQQLVNAPHCLFKKGGVTGASNYTVGIVDEAGKLQRVLYMLDSHGCWTASEVSLQQGVKRDYGFEPDQFAWLNETNEYVRKTYGDGIPAFACFHVAPVDVIEIFEHRGVYDRQLRFHKEQFTPYVVPENANGEFGEMNETMQIVTPSVFPTFKDMSVDGVFMGHYHTSNYSVVDNGIRWTHGLKTGKYDYHRSDMLGGTVIDVALKEKTFTVRHRYI